MLGAIVFVLQPCLCASCQPDFLHPLILLSFSLPLELFTLTNMEGGRERNKLSTFKYITARKLQTSEGGAIVLITQNFDPT